MPDDLPDLSRLPEDSAKRLHGLGIGAFVLLLLFLLLTIAYTLGEKFDNFRWSTFRNGLASFGMILLGACLLVVVVTAVLRGTAWLLPETFSRFAERRRLKKARKKALNAIDRRHQLAEERARLTARLQATFLYERETIRTANTMASQAFREALQSGVMQSCQIAFEHISRLIDQYERVVAEIEESSLPPAEKTELLESLARQMDIAGTEKRNADAQKMMEAQIWKVRFRKAKIMAEEKVDEALVYLQKIQAEARGPRMRGKIAAMIHSLKKEKTSG